MDAREYLRLAENLAKGQTEAEWRSAVSRAYYALFHIGRWLLLRCGFAVKRGEQAHAYIWRRLENCGYRKVQIAGAFLNTLRGDRNLADYDFDQPFHQAMANDDVMKARETVQVLEEAAAENIVQTIAEAMKEYELTVLKEVTWQGGASQ